MSEMHFDSKELMEILLEKLSIDCNEKQQKEIVKEYLEDFVKLPDFNIIQDFKKDLEWMNVKEPLSLKSHLKGKVVLLDFFTYCCINCMHILPDLKFLENKYKVEDGLVVIGVHSPKFSNEKHLANVAAAVKRYEIAHAVVNDSEESMWDALGIRCWPTLVVVGPSGELLLELMGEGHRAVLDVFIGECIQYFKSKGKLSHNPIPQIEPFQHSLPSSTCLSYPGKVITENDLVAIADTGNHRVVIANTFGVIKHIIGGPESGFCDGDFTEARFHSLQGLSFYTPTVLLVADTENHAIREINLATKKVKTLVGNGEQGNDRRGGKLWTAQKISSPWDVCIIKQHVLLIAIAGTHQIWALFLEDTTWWKNTKYPKGTCVAVAGSGREENRNNSYPLSAAFAQPSGLSYSDSLDSVFIADSESSTIRRLQLSDGKVTAVVGGALDPKNLFGFGDIDGKGTEAKMQHPLGIVWDEENKVLYVADTYNHKIKVVDPSTKQCKTFIEVNNQLNQFKEPAGLSLTDGNLYIADTNNHAIKVFNLKSRSTKKFVLQSPSEPKESSKVVPVVCEKNVQLSSQSRNLNIKIDLKLANGISLTPGAPSKWLICLPENCNWLRTDKTGDEKFNTSQEWNIKVDKFVSQTIKPTIKIDCSIFYCIRDVCSSQKLSFNIHVSENSDAPEDVYCSFSHVISS